MTAKTAPPRSLIDRLKPLYWALHPWFKNPRASYLNLLKQQNKYFNQQAILAMRRRGFSPQPVHPKHLFDEQRGSHVFSLLQPGMSFLDVGSGTGGDCIEAVKRGAARAVGLEYNPKNVQIARDLAQAAGVTVEIVHLDLEEAELPFPDASFDLINFSNVLEHLDNRTAILSELKRIKKSAAPIVISIPNTDTSWKKRLRRAGLDSRDDTDHRIEYNRETLAEEMKQAGLTIDSELQPIVPSFPWHGVIAFSAALSPRLYKRLQRWKRRHAQRHPEESIGWTFHAI